MEEPCDADVCDAQDEETYPIYGRGERKLDDIEVASDLIISMMGKMALVLGLVWARMVLESSHSPRCVTSSTALRSILQQRSRLLTV